MSVNLTIEGNLGGDPVIRFTQGGKSVASFSMVTSKKNRNADGSWGEDTEETWYDVTCWDTLGENVTESLRKGHSVIVTGRLYMDRYTDKEGNARQSLKVNAYNVAPSLRRHRWTRDDATAPAAAAVDNPWGAAPAQDDIPPF
jgi:single-strand DNA-binding protein